VNNADEVLFHINPQDAPNDLLKELIPENPRTKDNQIIELLRIANRALTMNELLVGCFRKYNIEYKRTLLVGRLYKLSKRGLVVIVGKGKYALIEGDTK